MRFTPIEKRLDGLRMFAGTLNRRLAVDWNNSIVLFKIEKQVDDFLARANAAVGERLWTDARREDGGPPYERRHPADATRCVPGTAGDSGQ